VNRKTESIPSIEFAGRPIGQGHPPFVIAELSGNHNGEIERAFRLIETAHAAGADAIKIQTYTADTITIDHDSDEFRIKGGLWDGRSLYDLYREAHTPWDWHPRLFACARDLGVPIFSTPFDFTAVDFLESLGAPAYKIASFECIDLPLIRKAAATDKPLIISTGIADETETGEAVEAARGAGHGGLALLHCVSAYPARPEDYNVSTVGELARRFGVVAGLSDHTLGTTTAVTAVALGACVIEKHMTLARADGGPDAAFSLEPDEFKRLVDDVRTAWSAVGRPRLERTEAEAGSVVFRRSLYVVQDVPAGGILTPENVRSIRPGLGLAPKYLDDVLGRRAVRDIARGTPLAWDLIAKR
jgi:N-acetylneuraminate synthase